MPFIVEPAPASSSSSGAQSPPPSNTPSPQNHAQASQNSTPPTQNGFHPEDRELVGYVNRGSYVNDPETPDHEWVEIRPVNGGCLVKLEFMEAETARMNIGGTWTDDLPVKVTFEGDTDQVKRVEIWDEGVPNNPDLLEL